MSTCPTGHFCPLGTSDPFSCGKASVCPSGSEREFVLDGFICVLIVDFFLLLYCLVTAFLSSCLGRGSLLGFMRSAKSKDGETAHELGEPVAIDSNDGSEDRSTESGAIGNFVASVKTSISPGNVGLAIRFDNVSLTIRGGKTILGPQSGFLEAGSLWGFMGPSGAGKSESSSHMPRCVHMRPFSDVSTATLVNILMGKVLPTSGSIFVNEAPVSVSR